MSTGKPQLTLVNNGAATAMGPAESATLAETFTELRDRLIRILLVQLRSVEDAEDIAQQAYLKLASREYILDNRNIKSLLFITARNLALDLHRQRLRHRKIFQEEADGADHAKGVVSSEPGADRQLIARERLQMVLQILGELPPKCSQAFIAYRFEDRDYRSIASEMGVSESMVRKYVIRAMMHCSDRFEELEGWE